MTGLTPPMARCIDGIRYLTREGIGPTMRELADHLGYSGKGPVHDLLTRMKGRGLVTWDDRRSRSLRIIEAPAVADLECLTTEQLRDLIVTACRIVSDRGAQALADEAA